MVLVNGKDEELLYAIVQQIPYRFVHVYPQAFSRQYTGFVPYRLDSVAEALEIDGTTQTARMRFLRNRENRGDRPSKSKVTKSSNARATKAAATRKRKTQAAARTPINPATKKRPSGAGENQEEENNEDDGDNEDSDEPLVRGLARRRRVSEAFSDSDHPSLDGVRLPFNKRAKRGRGKPAVMSTLEDDEIQGWNLDY